jgi:pyruvate/2-oxoglutarate/acetoin dehydrogenase E1 component/TPP-dependent pyruvate/acetoin dehydrogenase alpha subunit
MAKRTRKTSSRTKQPRGERPPLHARLAAFVAERFPFAVNEVSGIVAKALEIDGLPRAELADALEARRGTVSEHLRKSLDRVPPAETPETTPGVGARERLDSAADQLVRAVDGFLRREAITASLTDDERRELLGGMILTRATDNQLKHLFLSGEVRYNGIPFQGKGFRSLGQEAIYGAPLRLRRGAAYRAGDGTWSGDFVAPLIRDLGVALAMKPTDDTVRMVLNAQMGKAGPPMDGKDFHIGDLSWGIVPASAPLSVSTVSVAGIAMGIALRGEDRVAVAFVGEGASSLGEWHEAVNLCAARRLPAIFCVQNNQTALSTPVGQQSAVRVFADKAEGYGIPGITIDGTDPEAIAAAFAWSSERARAGEGPTLIETVSMRMCGHAHHDDMLYLGRDPHSDWDYPEVEDGGYADREAYAFWARRDPIATYAKRLEVDGCLAEGELDSMKREADERVAREVARVVEAAWPEAIEAGAGVFEGESPRRHVEVLENRRSLLADSPSDLPAIDPGPPVDPKGRTFLEAVMLGVGDALGSDERAFVYGQDVGGTYGNAFLLLRPLLERYGDRIVNAPLCEAGILGVCIGAAFSGMRPIGEIQFNDFVATGFNQLVNNAAKIRYRWGGSVPMVIRMPWGGLRRAGPFHSQNTEPWFYRTPGLKIVAPSTPFDARALMASAVSDPDPVLYYEHIGLYRNPKIKQALDPEQPGVVPLGKAALRRVGSDLALVSYGAYVHVCLQVAETLARDGIEASVLDLRSLVPLDRDTLLQTARHCGKVLIAHEDSRTGGIGESLAATIQEEAFERLDAPVRVVGALDTPVPYSPPLEDAYLPGIARVERAARLLAEY